MLIKQQKNFMFFLGETKNCSTSFPKASIDASTHAKVPCLGRTVVASQGHQKLLSSLVLTETSFFSSSTTTTHPSISRRIRQRPYGLNSDLLDLAHRSSSEFAIVLSGQRLGSRCFAELSSVCRRTTPCPVTAPPTNHQNSQAEKAGW
ncbi:hypothetical protein [Synechococcus sp. N19]|uniref:hypothetical protein n=1 Tax=Synechococcus sp. N19 TaxID=2575512 RepID=UPI0014833E21|nr:hypothetical protein [Synechococcus sp. N19]